MDLRGKTALVTGASSGIGFATAIGLATHGVRVAVHYFQNQAGAEEAVTRIRAAGGEAIALAADVRVAPEVSRLVEAASAALGPVEILVNNAGSLVERQKIREITVARWDEILKLNLTSAFLCSQAVAPTMIERRRGAIINVASIAGRNGGGPGAIAYATAKGGLITFTKALAKEMAAFGVRVNGVAPGVVWTPFHQVFSTEEALENFRRATPLGRLGRPEEVADTIVYLASERASFLVGETIEINGGLLMD
jgi:3-oxoacyl-[acyl-carrier protein] reductase